MGVKVFEAFDTHLQFHLYNKTAISKDECSLERMKYYLILQMKALQKCLPRVGMDG